MEELDLLTKLKIQFEPISDDAPSGKEVRESVDNGQSAYKDGAMDQFEEIDRKDLWK